MGYVEFLEGLFDDGRVAVPVIAVLPQDVVSAGDRSIAAYEATHRSGMPGDAPQFVVSAARWAATNFFRACQFAVYRDAGKDLLDQELSVHPPGPISPAVHYSVDLFFRYLPDLTRFARSAAEQDPLVEHLQQWATAWPLSSVGIHEIGEVTIDGFAECPSLMQVYVDRVIAAGDTSRLLDIRVREAVHRALGMFPNLDERISTALKKYDVQKAEP